MRATATDGPSAELDSTPAADAISRAVADVSIAGGLGGVPPEDRSRSEPHEPETSSGALISLARLAVDTGGRFTERTNDATLGYTRARHDLGCVYSLGFRDPGADDDRVRDLKIRVRRPGLRVVHPSLYVFRSDATREEHALRAAFVSPERAETGAVRAHLFPLRPSSKKRWEGLIAVSFPLPSTGATTGTAQRDFGAVLSKGASVAHSFNRRISLQPTKADSPTGARVVFLEPVLLAAGDYTLTVVVSDTRGREIEAVRTEIELPRVPRGEPFLVGPLLGRAAASNLLLTGGGEAPGDDRIGGSGTFEPLLVSQVDGSEDLVALTQVCGVGPTRKAGKRKAADGVMAIERSLREAGGKTIGSMPDLPLSLEEGEAVQCQNLVDLLPVSDLPHGEYVFEVGLRSGQDRPGPRQRVAFAVQ